MGCLSNTIGIHGCGDTLPASGIYIDSLPGISLKSIDSLADAEQVDYLGVWNDVQDLAERKLYVDVQAEMSKRYHLKRLSFSIDMGKEVNTGSITAAGSEYRGLLFDLSKAYGDASEYKQSALQSHYLQSISYYATGNHTFTIKVVDVVTNAVLDTFSKTWTIGWNTLTVNKNYAAEKIAVVVLSSAHNSVYLKVDSNLQWITSCTAAVEGFKYSSAADPSSGITTDNSYGLSVVYGVRCSFENLICNNQDLFYLPYAYLCATELTVMRQFSPRINKWTLNQKEADALRLYFEQEYQKALTQVVSGISLDTADCCLDCDGQMVIKEAHL